MDGKTLTEGKPWRLILAFTLPIIAGNALQQLYNTADMIIVGNFDSEAALSAVGTTACLTMLFIALAQGFSAGAGVITAQLFGAGRTDELRKNTCTSILLLTGMGIIASIIGFFSCGAVLKHILLVPDSLLDMAVTYFKIYALGLIFQFGYNIIAALLRSVGDSKATLYFLLIASMVNIVLDLLFVAVFQWGVTGAAIATDISQLCTCVAGILYMRKKYPLFRWGLKEFKFDKKIAVNVLRIGFPMAFQQAIVSCGFLFIQRAVNGYGEYMTASFSVEQRLENYLLMPAIAFQTAMATYSAQNIGAGKIKRIKVGLKQTLVLCLSITLCFSVIAFLLPGQIIGLFGIDGQSMVYCIQHLRSMAFGLLLFAAYFPFLGVFQGVGDGFYSTLVSTVALGCRVLFTYTLCFIPLFGYTSLWWSQLLGWLIAGVTTYTHYFRGKWKSNKSHALNKKELV